MVDRSRRELLRMCAVGTTTGLVGCIDRSGSENGETSGENTSPTATAQRDRAELQARIDELEAQIDELYEELDILSWEVSEKKMRIEILESTLEQKNERIEELESKVEESDFSEATIETVLAEAKKTREAVVAIRGDGGASGTAWFHEDGYLITNSHVVDGQAPFEAWTLDGESFEPELLGRSEYLNQPYHDVAVLDADISPPNTLSMGESNSLEEDQPMFHVGHPNGIGNWVVSIGRYVKDGNSDTVWTTVPTESGNSGSPLMTESGNVAGITTGSIEPPSGDSKKPTPSKLEVKEEFESTAYATHDVTSVIENYIEQFG